MNLNSNLTKKDYKPKCQSEFCGKYLINPDEAGQDLTVSCPCEVEFYQSIVESLTKSVRQILIYSVELIVILSTVIKFVSTQFSTAQLGTHFCFIVSSLNHHYLDAFHFDCRVPLWVISSDENF